MSEFVFDDTLQAIYFLSGRDQDWMAGVNLQSDGRVNVTYRIRHYDLAAPGDLDDDAHCGKDRMNWYKVPGTPGEPTLEKALQVVQEIMDTMQSRGYVPRGGLECKLVRGTMSSVEFFDEFAKLPFMQTRVVKPADPDFDEVDRAYKERRGKMQ